MRSSRPRERYGSGRAFQRRCSLIRAADTRRPAHALASLLTAAGGAWRLHEVPEGGHMAPVSRPDLVNPLIAGLLADGHP